MVDRDGLKVIDITKPSSPVLVENARLPLEDARNIYLARTYAYVSAGKQGVAIINVEQPEKPVLDQVFNAEGKLNDTNDVKLGMVSSSLFAFVADGKNGLQVVQLFSPQATPKFAGFSPRPVPKLMQAIAHPGRRLLSPAASIVTGRWTNRAINWQSSAGVVRDLSIARKCKDSISAMGAFIPFLTIPRARQWTVPRKSPA